MVAVGMLLLGNLHSYGRTPTFAQKENYTAYISGFNKVHFSLPLYDCNLRDRWANSITVYAGSSPIFTYKTYEDDYNKCTAETYNVGRVQIWTSTGFQDMTANWQTFKVSTPGYDATDASYVEFDWYAPSEWKGEYQIYAKGQYR